MHEFHVWQLTGNRVIASAHVRCHNSEEYMIILGKIKKLFHNEGIHSVTIQPEYSEVGVCLLSDMDIYPIVSLLLHNQTLCIGFSKELLLLWIFFIPTTYSLMAKYGI